ncbi:MAG: hypothetical protein E7432_09440 [Ruminococcaceae bacterium]|nr:hypothetical protein [Oscillospiraceae bacterium]
MFFQFDSELARLYGVDEAVFLHNLYFWLRHNEATGTNIIEYNGEKKVWSYHSKEAFCKVFPFWNRRQIERVIDSCRNKELILTAVISELKLGRTLCYTLTPKVYDYYTKTCNYNTEKCQYTKDNIKYNKKDEGVKPSLRKEAEKDAKAYGPHKWIYLTDRELDALIADFGEVAVAKAVQYVDIQAQKTGNRNGWQDWNITIRDAINRNWGGIMDDIR